MFTIICIVSSAEASAQDLATLIDQAQKGDPESQFILAYRYHDGDGVPTDYAIAFQWWMKAAQQGHVESQYNVAFLYERGEGSRAELCRSILLV